MFPIFQLISAGFSLRPWTMRNEGFDFCSMD
jgi:hypothetical protein